MHKLPTSRILVHEKGGISSYWGKDQLFSNQMVLKHDNWITSWKMIKLESLLIPHTRINYTLTEDLNIKIKNYKYEIKNRQIENFCLITAQYS